MGWIVANIGWLLIVSGVATCSMIAMTIAPRWAMQSTFGEVAEGQVANLIARSWGVMIFASGLMLIYAAGHPDVRLPVLLYSIVGKLGFVVLVFASPVFRSRGTALLALGDLIIVAILAGYLAAA